MPRESGVFVRWTTLSVGALALLAAGASAGYLALRWSRPPSGAQTPTLSTAVATGAAANAGGLSVPSRPADVMLTLAPEVVLRAGIEVTTVGTSASVTRVRVPGVVQANAYKSVVITALAAGRVTRVFGALGQHVRQGQTLADVYSPEMADAQTRYLSSGAQLEAHEQALRRTEKLVAIGAASQQELEKIHAEHTAATTRVASERAYLLLLGMTDGDVAALSSSSGVASTIRVSAPFDGVITAREANIGLNVESNSPLFTVVDLSSVWVVGELYERDFGMARVGTPAIVTTTAYPDSKLTGAISYIDPQVKMETRTAQIRVEVPNRNGQLRLGMYADIELEEKQPMNVLTIPRSAVQVVSDRSVVYLADATTPGRFTEREVTLGEGAGDNVRVTSGLQVGDVVVSKGSFSLRAERDRLGPRRAATSIGAGGSAPP